MATEKSFDKIKQLLVTNSLIKFVIEKCSWLTKSFLTQ